MLSLVETFEEGQNFRRTLVREPDGLDFDVPTFKKDLPANDKRNKEMHIYFAFEIY